MKADKAEHRNRIHLFLAHSLHLRGETEGGAGLCTVFTKSKAVRTDTSNPCPAVCILQINYTTCADLCRNKQDSRFNKEQNTLEPSHRSNYYA